MYIYAIENTGGQRVKIGISKDVKRRYNTLKREMRTALEFRFCVDVGSELNAREIEAQAHYIFLQRSVNGTRIDIYGARRPKDEWFYIDWRSVETAIKAILAIAHQPCKVVYELGYVTKMTKTTYKNSASVRLMDQARECYLFHPRGLTDQGLAELLDVSRMTAYRIRLQLTVTETDIRGMYRYKPDDRELKIAQQIIYVNSLKY
jgi:hypothetical protein